MNAVYLFDLFHEQTKAWLNMHKSILRLKHLLGVLFLILSNAVCTAPAWAVQQHGGAEGLVSHQIGHLLFIFGMSYMLFLVYHIGLSTAGWLHFKRFLWLILLWNVLTFSGHWLMEIVDQAKFVKVDDRTVGYSISSFTDAVFYLSRLDHLVLVPAFVFLLLALKRWRHYS